MLKELRRKLNNIIIDWGIKYTEDDIKSPERQNFCAKTSGNNLPYLPENKKTTPPLDQRH